MITRLDDSALLKNDNTVRIFDCGQSMCDDDGRSVLCCFVERGLYNLLATDINGTCRFIQNQNIWVLTIDRAMARRWR